MTNDPRIGGIERIRSVDFVVVTHCPSPGVDELVAILEDRVRWALEPDSITDEGITRIADAAAGDARKAISILRNAAKTAQHTNQDHITDDVITEAVPEATAEIQQRSLEKLNDHQAVLHEIITEAGEITPSELYDRYTDRVEDPKTQRTMRTYLSKMEHYNLITGEGATKSRVYQPV